MYKSLAVALDGSSQAEKALPVAVHLAKLLPARLLLLHVCMEQEEGTDTWQNGSGVNIKPEMYLGLVKDKLTGPSKIFSLPADQVETKVVYGKYAYELGDVAAAEGVDLLVMT